MTTVLRGRAASAIRPGIITKRVLLGELPLDTGELITEAAIVDLFNAYKRQLREYNQVHEKVKHIGGMCYRSFYTMFKFAQLLHLVEFVREEEADWKRKTLPTPATSLIRLERSPATHRITRKISNRRVFRLSEVGRQDVKSWLNLTTAWKEQWPAPQIIEIPVIEERMVPAPEVVEEVPAPPTLITEAPAAKAKRGRPPGAKTAPKEERIEVPRPHFSNHYSKEQIPLLITHIEELQQIGVDKAPVLHELKRLAEDVLGEWIGYIIEDYDEARSFGMASKALELRRLNIVLTTADEGLLDLDLTKALENLRKLL